jgi:hypothetical protein
MSVGDGGGTGGSLDVSVVIISYNTADWTRRCLASLYEQTRDVDFEVLLVDNASSDGSAAMVSKEFADVRLIVMGENVGFGRAVNLAARQATGRYLLLLNPDAEVVDGAVQHLVRFADTSPINRVYGGRTLRPEGGLNPTSCWGLPSVWSLVCFATGLSTAFRQSRLFDPESLGNWQRDSVRTVGMVTGCLLLIDRALWERLGGFDPVFFMYGEDADLCIRATDLGASPVITPSSTVIHAVGASTARRADKMTLVMKAKVTLVRKHWREPRRSVGVHLLLAGVAVRAALTPLSRARGTTWVDVWRDREQWQSGYLPPSLRSSRSRRLMSQQGTPR